MKKLSLLVLAAATAFAASAQMDAVKEAERAMKGGKATADVVKIITPAFNDPATAELAQTWYIPGAAAFKEFDHMIGLKAFNKLPADGEKTMGHLLIDGYNYYMKALPLDTVTDPKGKVKTKYSKEIINTLAGHAGDYVNSGVELYNIKDYDGAYKVWDIFCAIPSMPAAREALKKNGALQPDSTYGEIAFNQALAAWQLDSLDNALNAFIKAKNFGYTKKPLYDYAIAVASQLKNNDALLAIAQEALPLYGDEDPMYMSQIVNYYLLNKQLDKAFEIINQAIAKEPSNAQYYVVQGVLYENSENNPDAKKLAKEAYKKAMDLDAKNEMAVYNYGRALCEEAYALGDAAPTRQDEYTAYFNQNIKPLFLEAADILENAYEINPENPDVLKYLENIYYNLNDEKKLQNVKKRMTY